MPECRPPRLAPDTPLLPATDCAVADYSPTSSTCACRNSLLSCQMQKQVCAAAVVLAELNSACDAAGCKCLPDDFCDASDEARHIAGVVYAGR